MHHRHDWVAWRVQKVFLKQKRKGLIQQIHQVHEAYTPYKPHEQVHRMNKFHNIIILWLSSPGIYPTCFVDILVGSGARRLMLMRLRSSNNCKCWSSSEDMLEDSMSLSDIPVVDCFVGSNFFLDNKCCDKSLDFFSKSNFSEVSLLWEGCSDEDTFSDILFWFAQIKVFVY